MQCQAKKYSGLSLSARRAWIEMPVSVFTNFFPAVALRKESVDRNRHLRYDVSD